MSNIEQYTEKTVDFKVISSYKKNVNALNKISYENSDKYKDLIKFIKPYKLSKEDKRKPNITSPTGRYLITGPDAVFEFFSHLKACNEQKLILHFRELQHTNIQEKEGSGIMLDFDIYQDNNNNIFDKGSINDFIKKVAILLCSMLEYKDMIETYIGLIVKPKIVYIEDKKLYKNGFHLIISNIWLSREQKKIFLKNILSSKSCCNEFFKAFGIKLEHALDMACASVPVYFLYNCKEDATSPYLLKQFYKFSIKQDEDNELEKELKELGGEDSGINYLKELSISFPYSSLPKQFYNFNEQWKQALENYLKEKGKIEEEREYSIAVFDHHNTYADENLEYYKQLVMNVLDEKRAVDRESWRNTVFAIANISKSLRQPLKEIARQFSMRCESKYDTDAFENIWSDATKDDGKNKLTFNSIVYWAKEDNKSAYDSLLDKDIKTTIELDTYSSENRVLTGALYQYHYAYYIFHLFKHKFVYDIDGKYGKWFEFVMENDSSKKGEMYKWRHEIKPDNLNIYISNRLPDIVSKVLEKADARKEKTTEENIIKFLTARSDNLRKSAQCLYKTEFKNGVLREAESLFRRRGFIDSLDQSENVFGVANGVLILDDKVKFVQGFHDYPVSLYSEINYRPFDITSEGSKTLLRVILGLFPEDEMDMFHYLMYFLCTCLDNRPKDSMFLILQGHGCHGINTKIKMFDGTNKLVQDIKIGDKIMGDDSSERNVKQLFRGRDIMYKVISTENKFNSFIVNQNHILSLKSKDKIIDIKLCDYINSSNKYNLYNFEKKEYKFKLEKLEEDNYYGFELDGNHRYLTSDYIVHHNSNGKSSLLELTKTILGKYGAKVNMSILTENRGGSGSANEQFMAYVNARLAFYSETNKQEEMNCATMKEFTSLESMTGRGIFQTQKTFRPKCNHVITTNFLPIIKTTDYGTWRRLKLYTFKMSFKPEKDIDPNNKYEKVADEKVAKEFSYNEEVKEAYLSLLVEYYKHFKSFHNGKFSNILSPTLEKDSLGYRNSMDTMNKFICNNIIISKDSSISINELVDSYISFLTEEYGKNNNVQKNEIKQIIMNSALNKFISKNNVAKAVFKGIRLLDTEDEDERLLEGEYFYDSSNVKSNNEEKNVNTFDYDITKFDPLNLNEWRKNNM